MTYHDLRQLRDGLRAGRRGPADALARGGIARADVAGLVVALRVGLVSGLVVLGALPDALLAMSR